MVVHKDETRRAVSHRPLWNARLLMLPRFRIVDWCQFVIFRVRLLVQEALVEKVIEPNDSLLNSEFFLRY